MELWLMLEEIGGGGKNTGNCLEGVFLCFAAFGSFSVSPFSVSPGAFSSSSFRIAFLSRCGDTWREVVLEERRLDTEEEDRLVDLEEGCDRSRSILSWNSCCCCASCEEILSVKAVAILSASSAICLSTF